SRASNTTSAESTSTTSMSAAYRSATTRPVGERLAPTTLTVGGHFLHISIRVRASRYFAAKFDIVLEEHCSRSYRRWMPIFTGRPRKTSGAEAVARRANERRAARREPIAARRIRHPARGSTIEAVTRIRNASIDIVARHLLDPLRDVVVGGD